MYATDRMRGASLVASLILSVTVAAFCISMAVSSKVANDKAQVRLQSAKAFYIAEGGLDFALAQIREDTAWAVTDTARFPTLDEDGTLRSDWIPLGDGDGDFRVEVRFQAENALPADWTGTGWPDGYEHFSTVALSGRDALPDGFDQLEVSVTGRYASVLRRVSATVQFEVQVFRAAIVGDAPAASDSNGSGKGAALKHRHVSFKPGNQYVYGGVHTNAKIVANGQVTSDNVADTFDRFEGDLAQELYGTAQEVPDYTNPGSSEQLFDFGRFEAAATAGAGQVFTTLDDFAAAMKSANDAGEVLEGIIYLKIDSAEEGNGPKLDVDDGINIRGTLVFDFTNEPDDFYKVFILCPLNINAGELPADFDPADPSTFATGYPPTITASKDPRGFAMNHATYEDFPDDADMPALMFDTGTVDIHGAANICGAVYGPSFIEIENKSNNLQYFSGAILGGGGIYLQGNSASGAAQVFCYDASAVGSLPTFGELGTSPVITGYIVGD